MLTHLDVALRCEDILGSKTAAMTCTLMPLLAMAVITAIMPLWLEAPASPAARYYSPSTCTELFYSMAFPQLLTQKGLWSVGDSIRT